MSIFFRHAQPNEAEIIHDIYMRSSMLPSTFYTPEELSAMISISTLDTFRDSIQRQTMTVAEIAGGMIIGLSEIKMDDDGVLFVYKLFIDPKYIGQGYGSKLLHNMEQQIYSRGQRKSRLYARLNAVSFYEQNGYTIIEEYRENISGIDISFQWMEKILF